MSLKKRATEDKVTLQSHWGLFQATWHGYLCIWRWLGEFWWMFEGVIGCCCSRPACCSHFHSHNMIHLFAKSKHNSLVLFASGVVSGVFFKGEELTDWIEESLANRYWLGWMGGGVFFFLQVNKRNIIYVFIRLQSRCSQITGMASSAVRSLRIGRFQCFNSCKSLMVLVMLKWELEGFLHTHIFQGNAWAWFGASVRVSLKSTQLLARAPGDVKRSARSKRFLNAAVLQRCAHTHAAPFTNKKAFFFVKNVSCAADTQHLPRLNPTCSSACPLACLCAR